ncbi:MAG: HAMP domain-containing histidine kinase [Kiritimatiellae bacterium]|nr:HAMP domain-containing histidine kinase [Kiritimatiellia bacterium]
MTARDPSRRFSVVATVVAAAAFAAVIAAFAAQVVSFGRDVERWARRDLRTQAELTAAGLAAPLRTQDFRRLREVAAALELKGLVLRVRSPGGGVLYDGGRGEPMLEESAAAGEHSVAVAIRREQVFEPFRRAVALFALAALVGALGMFVVFFALYRQRVRIRELARAERFRREFVADVSHEIKTPLTGIIGAAEMIGEADDSARPRLAAMIAKESKRLNALVQQILDLARLDREGAAPERARTDLAGLVREILEERRAEAESRGVELVFRGSGEVSADCDATLVAEAVSNLVGNAIRHSGSPKVEVSCAATAHGVEIAVEDHGVGIPPEHAERVFERFHRIDPARAAESGGAGLGLAIVRRIARLHGGDVRLEPVSPHGCRFVLGLR